MEYTSQDIAYTSQDIEHASQDFRIKQCFKRHVYDFCCNM